MQLFRLEQEPELQGALVSIDPHRQYLAAMVGGYDFDANEYNRAFQACRQPGVASSRSSTRRRSSSWTGPRRR